MSRKNHKMIFLEEKIRTDIKGINQLKEEGQGQKINENFLQIDETETRILLFKKKKD